LTETLTKRQGFFYSLLPDPGPDADPSGFPRCMGFGFDVTFRKSGGYVVVGA
jgi:hypothetical protein